MTLAQSFEKFRGQWIIISNDEILAHDSDLRVILRKAKEYKDIDVTVRKVLAGQACYY